MLAVDTGKVVGVFRYHFEDIVSCTRHQMALQNIGNARHSLFKGIKHLIRLGLKRDLHKHRCRHTKFAGIEQRDIVSDIALALKPLHPPMTGRS